MSHRFGPVCILLTLASVVPSICSALDIGPCIGTHSTRPYTDQFGTGEDGLLLRAGIVGVQAEELLGSTKLNLRAAFLGNYSQTWYSENNFNWYRGGMAGINVRAAATFTMEVVPGTLEAGTGLALTYDWYDVWGFGRKCMTVSLLSQGLTAGFRIRPANGLQVALDCDLDLAREGTSDYYFYKEEPTKFCIYNFGIMEPSVTFGVLWSR